jgi:hypothetical protein
LDGTRGRTIHVSLDWRTGVSGAAIVSTVMARRGPEQPASYRPLLITAALAVCVVAADLAWRAHTATPTPTVDEAPPLGSAVEVVDRAQRLAADRYGIADPVLVHLVLGGIDAKSFVDVASETAPGGMAATFASRGDPGGRTALVAYGANGMTGGPMAPGLAPQVAPASCDVRAFLVIARERGIAWDHAMVTYGLDEEEGEERGVWRLEESTRVVLKLRDDECAMLAAAGAGARP